MKCFYSFLFLLGSLLASGQTTDVKYLSGMGLLLYRWQEKRGME